MTYDLLIIGGGINGCAIAREAALNGWSALLVEKDDLANHTSSASTKLIHGGLRYLETYDFKLVREALHERKRLLKAAPHLIHPMHFVLPHENAVRPWWMVRAGLFLYDLLGGFGNLQMSRRLKASDQTFRLPLKHKGSGFVYSDCAVDDARLTILNAVDAAGAGADIRTRTAFKSAKRDHRLWDVTLSDGSNVKATAIVNAAGPWLSNVDTGLGIAGRHTIRLVKGSHIVVPALFAGSHSYMLQQPDRRIVFAIPWANGTTMIGTTEEAVSSPEAPTISAEETDYLLDAANTAFVRQSAASDIVYTWAGVRPLVDDGAADARTTTRDYILDLDNAGAPLLSVLGGKITTARHLAEDAMAKLGAALARPVEHVTKDRPFPGGKLPTDFSTFVERSASHWPFLGLQRTARMAGAYGLALAQMLEGVETEDGLGRDFGHGLTAREVDWLMDLEWAQTADDILWRRTKLGLLFDARQAKALATYMKKRAAA